MTKEKEQVKAEKEIKEEIAIQEAETEIHTGERVVDLPNLGEVIISFPSIAIDQECKQLYSKEVIKLMEEGELKPARVVEKMMRANGSWTDEDDEEVDKMTKELQNLLITIHELRMQYDNLKPKRPNVKKVRKELEDKIAENESKRIRLQRRLIELGMYKENLLSTSIEERSSRQALNYKMYKCTTKDGKPLFSSFDKMLTYNKSKDLERLSGECLTFWSGIEDPLLESLVAEMIGS